MRILYLSPRQCWPVISGAKLRDYHLARALAAHGTVTYLYFPEPGLTETVELPFCERVISLPRRKPYSPRKIAQGLFGRWPISVLNYFEPEAAERILQVARSGEFDLIHLDSLHMAGYIRLLKDTLPSAWFVLDWHNIESELMRRYSGVTRSPLRKLYATMTARQLERLEKWMLLEAVDGHIVCSNRECETLLRIAPQARVAVVENGVDTSRRGGGGAGARNRLVFVGSMDYHANIESATWFARTIWPALHRRFPQWTLTLVGSRPTPEVRVLAGADGIEVTGTVPDVYPYYEQAFAAVVPLLTGGGTRLKILEAMAAGVPVISTSIGAEGLAVTSGDDILIADDASQWDAAVETLHEPAQWRRFADAGRRLAESRYDWGVLGDKLNRVYRGLVRLEGG